MSGMKGLQEIELWLAKRRYVRERMERLDRIALSLLGPMRPAQLDLGLCLETDEQRVRRAYDLARVVESVSSEIGSAFMDEVEARAKAEGRA